MSDFRIQKGDMAPDFQLPTAGDRIIKLSDFRGKKNVILSFHPLAWTGICAAQMEDLQKEIRTLNENDTIALGISVDSVPSKLAWAESLGIKDVLMLSDFEPKGAVAKEYGIYREAGTSERAVFVVDKKGIVKYAKVYPISEKPDLTEVLKVIL